MKKKVLMISFKQPKHRDLIALELYANKLYKHKVIKSKKIYNRKKLKKGLNDE